MRLVSSLPGAPPVIDPSFERQFMTLRRQRRLQTLIGVSLFALLFFGASIVGKFSPAALIEGAPKLGEYIQRTLPVLRWDSLGADIAEWFYGIRKWLDLLFETVLMAYLATLMGSLLALGLCFFASRNLTPQMWTYHVARRLGEFFRTVPDLVFALIFVFAFGLGPLPGILAMALHSFGANTKLFSEANENIDMGPVEGLRASGASWVQTMRFAVLPQVMPNYASYVLWRFEINVRTAAVLGFVGAGGIGMELMTAVRSLYYEDISAILILIVLTVTLIDLGCEKLRHWLIGRETLE
ncbi:phosphonate ABC transporter, permease protein PhnE [Pseudorhodoplanes sp.]|uniref:phosphonate ABC transporter, permease protein PhnE n=1 Tax=Pseudorhodoplanes sp. TaxID=1934341 RepID=UPI00391C02E0